MSGERAGAMQRAKHLLSVVAESRPVRVWEHYSDRRGNLLAGGVAYVGLFSIGAALVVGFTVLNAVLGGNDELRERVILSVDQQLPGLLDVGPDGGAVAPEQFFGSDFTSWAGITALVIALYSGLRWLDGVRKAIRAVFGCPKDETFIVLKKIKDTGVLATLGVAILISAVLGLGVSSVGGWLLDLAGLDGSTAGALVLRALGVLVVLLVDMAIFMVLFHLLSGLDLPWRLLWSGALVGAIGTGLLKLFGGLLLNLLGGGGSNPLLAGSAILVGVLLWMNLVSRVMLLAAAWTATAPGVATQPAADGGDAAPTTGDDGTTGTAASRPARARVPIGPVERGAPSFGQRASDRTSLAAGAVLGAAAVTGVRMLRDAGRAVRDLARAPLE